MQPHACMPMLTFACSGLQGGCAPFAPPCRSTPHAAVHAHPIPCHPPPHCFSLTAGVIATDLARQLLNIYPNTYALVVCTENLTYNWYPGTNRGMLVTNTIFRVGGAALLLSNKRRESGCAWVVGHPCLGF